MRGGIMMKKAKRIIMLVIFILLSMAVVCTTAQAAAKYVLKFNHVLAPTDPFHAGFTKWAKAVNERTKGGMDVQVFHSAQLGVEEDIIEQLRQGANVGKNTA